AERLRQGPRRGTEPPRRGSRKFPGGANSPVALPFRGRPIVEAAQNTVSRHIRGTAGGVRERRMPPGGGCLALCYLGWSRFPSKRASALLPASFDPLRSRCLA